MRISALLLGPSVLSAVTVVMWGRVNWSSHMEMNSSFDSLTGIVQGQAGSVLVWCSLDGESFLWSPSGDVTALSSSSSHLPLALLNRCRSFDGVWVVGHSWLCAVHTVQEESLSGTAVKAAMKASLWSQHLASIFLGNCGLTVAWSQSGNWKTVFRS